MKYNTFEIEVKVPYAEDGYVFDVGSLYEQLMTVTDTRHARGKRYELALVLVLVILAKLCGQDHPYGIAQWAHAHRAMLCKLLGVPRTRLPAHNTLRRILGGVVDSVELQAVLSRFLTHALPAEARVVVTLDGKTLRGSLPAGQPPGVRLLAAYVPNQGVVLAQLMVAAHENEIVVAPRLLQKVDLRGKVVRGDALHTQRALSAQIVEAGGEYVWIVKDNQPGLLHDIRLLFEAETTYPQVSPPQLDFKTATTTDKSHGRGEIRTLTASSALQGYSDWPYLAQVFRLERRAITLKDGTLRDEVVYGVTSLRPDEADPSRLLALVREYWGIENGLHYRRDVTLHEDAARMSNPKLAETMAVINNAVIGLVARAGWPYLPEARRHYAAHLADALNLVLRAPN